ncbi:MAG: MqnA/MqnD/SBP family protein [Victivallaceae bacterium]
MLVAAFSSCPNDIFLFRSFLTKKSNTGLFSKLIIKDIESLNNLAKTGTVCVIKISAAFYPIIQDRFELLQVGSTFGYNHGPKIIARQADASLIYDKVGFPGQTTTAYRLFRKFYSCRENVFLPYSEIPKHVQSKAISAGVIIHESGLICEKMGLHELTDLGKLWYQRTKLPLPLGCIAISRYLHDDMKKRIREELEASLRESLSQRQESLLLAAQYSQEKDLQVIDKFIDTYVSRDTLCISNEGLQALINLWS